MISGDLPRGAFCLAIASVVLLLPTALIKAYQVAMWGWAEVGAASLWFLFPLVLTLLILFGAFAVRRRMSRLRLWGWIILVSASLQLIAGLTPTAYGPRFSGWLPEEAQFLEEPLLILGVLCGMMSGILLIAESRGSTGQT